MKIALLGITFKENCPDLRNSKAYEIYKIFKNSNIHIDVYDPQADKNDARKEYGINLLRNITFSKYDVLIFAVNHKEYANINFKEMRSKMKKNCVVYDVKSFLPQQLVTERL
jgi:UDP-N-acetyl-D-galactosamine dehydrogenase